MLYDELTSENKKKFDASRFKEIDNLLKFGALSVMSVKDSEHFVNATPENIMPTNMLDKWKRQDDGTMKAKSRIVLWAGKIRWLPIGTCSTNTNSRSYHGDITVVDFREGVGKSHRFDQWDHGNCYRSKQKFMDWCLDQVG